MNRRLFFIVLSLTAACTRSKEQSLTQTLPVQVERSWVLKETRNLTPEEAPPLVRSLGLRRALTAVYRTNSEIRLQVFEMASETGAFELIQKWRQSDGLAIYKGPYFVVVEKSDTDPESLKEFLKAMQADLGTGTGVR